MSEDTAMELKLAFPIAQLKEQLKLVDDTINQLLVPEDYAMLSFYDKETKKTEKKPFIRKTGWERAAFAFGLSFDTVHYWKEELSDGEFVYHVSVCVWKGARKVTRSASCASDEKSAMDDKPEQIKARKPHDVFTTAEARAFGRACISFFGYHGHSAEEMMAGSREVKPQLKKICDCRMGTNFVDMTKTPPECKTCGGIIKK